MTTATDYERVCGDIKRWRSRLKRAMTMLTKLEQKRQRLDRKMIREQVEGEIRKEAAPVAPPPSEVVKLEAAPVAPPPADDDIPDFLRRGMAAQKAVDDVIAAEAVKAELAAEKKRKTERRIEKLKIGQEHKQAELTGARRKMPLTGKAALAAIRRP